MTLKKNMAFGLAAAGFLAACGGANTPAEAENFPEVDPNALVTLCPGGKILTSTGPYNAIVLPSLEDNAAWHAENGKRSDVTTTASGLQYKVVQAGLENGASPVGGEKVTVHYHGYFPDGKIFDSSYDRGQTIDFPANAVIAGWVEALQDMKTCEARTLYVPGDLAYGPQGRPRSGIPPNATLLFNVQLIGVKKN